MSIRKHRWALIICLLAMGCHGKKESRITLHLTGGFNRLYEVTMTGLNGEKDLVVDSGRIRSNHDSLVITLPVSEERIWRIYIPEKGLSFFCVNDTPDLIVRCNIGRRTCEFPNSPASTAWADFQKSQNLLTLEQHRLAKVIDSLAQSASPSAKTDSVKQSIFSLIRKGDEQNLHLADTTHEAGLFLLANARVDFGNDYKGLEQYSLSAGRRFPDHMKIQAIVKSNLDYVQVFGRPLKVGDSIPDLALPDRTGQLFSFSSIRNRYFLINFWSTYCLQCKPFFDVEKGLPDVIADRLERVSILVDNHRDKWMSIVDAEGYQWAQLIDDQMWNGQAVKAFRVDSIPYNFLVGPDRKILAKNIPTDSLVSVLIQNVK